MLEERELMNSAPYQCASRDRFAPQYQSSGSIRRFAGSDRSFNWARS